MEELHSHKVDSKKVARKVCASLGAAVGLCETSAKNYTTYNYLNCVCVQKGLLAAT